METSVASSAVAEPEVLESTCLHQWMIASPNGPSSKGTCLACGTEKEFPNYIEGSAWGYDISVEQLAKSAKINVRPQPAIDEDYE
jgi:hypothetical protein